MASFGKQGPRDDVGLNCETKPIGRYAPLSSRLAIVRKALGRQQIATVQTTDIDGASRGAEFRNEPNCFLEPLWTPASSRLRSRWAYRP